MYAEGISVEDARPLKLKSGTPTLCVEAMGVLEDGTIFDFAINRFSLKQYSFEYTSPRSTMIQK